MEGQHLDVLSDSADASGSYGALAEAGTTATDDHTVHLPAYLAYLSLGFKVISTMIIVAMAGWIIVTIKTTRSLHKTHNIYVAYIVGIDAFFAFTSTLLSGVMMIGHFTGLGDFIGCNVFVFMLYPTGIIFFTFLLMSIDKVVAITFPFKHCEIMTPRVVCGIIVVKHIVVVMMYVKDLFTPDNFTKVAQFGTCTRHDSGFLVNLIAVTIPMFSSCFITVILDVYLTIKAYKVHKQIQEESKLSGGHTEDNDQLKALKKKEYTIKKHLKPMITLFVVVTGNSFFGLMYPVMFLSIVLFEFPAVYENIVRYIVTPNIGYITFLLHPFAYALYFKQVREPMMRLLKRITRLCKCKSAAVAPESQRNRMI